MNANGIGNNKADTSIPLTAKEIMTNPYHTNERELGKLFYRKDVIDGIKKFLKKQSENKFIILQGSPGSGKTSTLKHIQKNPETLGSDYIPVYIDSRDCIGLDSNNLLSFAFDVIYKRLDDLRYSIPALDNIKETFIKDLTVASSLLTIDSYLDKKVLFLILDEFDHLLENVEVKIISDFIKLFQYIEKNWGNYGLIIVGDKRLVNLTGDEIINNFMETANHIKIDGFLEKKAINEYITEPVKKGEIVYDDDSLQYIIWYSGSHLYFQQLICYYIANSLIEENRTQCSKRDVKKAIQRILKEGEGNRRPEFAITWENQMSVEIRLIASALMDEDITERRNNTYFLKENNLLENIFAGEIYKEIKKFPGSSYFNKMKERGFPEFPLRVPLLGLWIRKEHPFIKTIIEHIEFIAEKIDMDAINAEIEKAPVNKLPPFGREAILDISKNWRLLDKNIKATPPNPDKTPMERFRKSLSQLLNLDIKESETKRNYFVIDIKNLNIGILKEAFCFIQDRPEITEKDIFNIENIATSVARDTKTQLTLYFHFRKSTKVEELVKKPYLNLIAIDTNDLKRIIFSNRPRETTRKIILSSLSLQKVSPYQTTGPTTATFYGRTADINEITGTTNTSYSIVGARKIGKTSLLYKITSNPPPNTYYIFMNLDPVFKSTYTYKPFLRKLESKIEEMLNEKVDMVRFTNRKSLARLSEVIQKLSQKRKKIIFVFDEVDILIKFDRKHEYRLLHTFRTMAQTEKSCQFIFAGFEELYHRKRDINNPLYNFCEEIMLAPLDREAALDLITKPLQSIGIHYQDKEDKELILKYTACHPNLLQFYCKQLINRIENHVKVEERRTIFRKDICELFNSEYKKYIMDDIYMFYSDLTNINRLILILLVETQLKQKNDMMVTFSVTKVRNKLIERGIEVPIAKVHRNLRNLVMRFILLNKGNDEYYFALPTFPIILRERIDRDLKYSLIEEIKKEIKIDPKSL